MPILIQQVKQLRQGEISKQELFVQLSKLTDKKGGSRGGSRAPQSPARSAYSAADQQLGRLPEAPLHAPRHMYASTSYVPLGDKTNNGEILTHTNRPL